jgi:hypothetical protein
MMPYCPVGRDFGGACPKHPPNFNVLDDVTFQRIQVFTPTEARVHTSGPQLSCDACPRTADTARDVCGELPQSAIASIQNVDRRVRTQRPPIPWPWKHSPRTTPPRAGRLKKLIRIVLGCLHAAAACGGFLKLVPAFVQFSVTEHKYLITQRSD